MKDHPGKFIKTHVLPKSLKITEAAKILGVGRPALSNLLNEKSSLSPEMAAKIERAFKYSASDLLEMQAKYNTQQTKSSVHLQNKLYTPIFLQFKSKQFSEWVTHNIQARARLSVLLRTLVNSSGAKLEKVDFPGNDDSQRHGWDGFTIAIDGNPWVPNGSTGWEFGVDPDSKSKARKDFAARTNEISKSEREKINFIFVTPHVWKGKDSWEKEMNDLEEWKSVRAYDASDLEQWMEQSIVAQTWFANESGIFSDGIINIENCWTEWLADCPNTLGLSLFASQVEQSLKPIKEFMISENGPLIIKADSIIEALAFIFAAFSQPDLINDRDRIVYFTTPGLLNKLLTKGSQFIPVISSREVERELAPHNDHQRSIIVHPRNSTAINSTVELEPLSYSDLCTALKINGCDSDTIERLITESGGSLTVLRRRLSKNEGIKTPAWVNIEGVPRMLIPFVFAGSWNFPNDADKTILEYLSNGASYRDLENNFTRLLLLDDSPVWSADFFNGIVSKIDTLFSIRHFITQHDIKNFLDVAELVLSEDNPALDLPEDKRWAAFIYKKIREISSSLRKGISETLILISLYGDVLFKDRININYQFEVDQLIRKILTPLSERKLESQIDDFSYYAEAAPNTFLDIIEHDIASDNSFCIGIMRPAGHGIFGRSSRTGLLWALEKLAWSNEYFLRVVLILARLSQKEIIDNWSDKPLDCLNSIFRNWMPQTSASLNRRISALDLIIEKFPDVAWNVCLEQFSGKSTFGTFNQKPKWRKDGFEFGNSITKSEADQFILYTIDKAIQWKNHTKQSIGDLVMYVNRFPFEAQEKVWSLVETWAMDRSENDRAWVREKIRQASFTTRALLRKSNKELKKSDISQKAKNAYDALLPEDLILRYEWLFRENWVDESIDQIDDFKFNIREQEVRIRSLRKNALNEIFLANGIDGVLKLVSSSNASHIIGELLNEILGSNEYFIKIICHVIELDSSNELKNYKGFIFGLLFNLPDNDLENLLYSIRDKLSENNFISILILCPFKMKTWEVLGKNSESMQETYWKKVQPHWVKDWDETFNTVINNLLLVHRPRAAFSYIHLDLEKVNSEQIFRIMKAMMTSSIETLDSYPMDSYALQRAFDQLNEKNEIASHDMAVLEFLYIDLFNNEEGKLRNLEFEIEKNPDLFVHAIVSVYMRSDDKVDPEGIVISEPEKRARYARTNYALLEKLSRIPGYDENGELNAEKIEKWVGYVREKCGELGRSEVCDSSLGKLFSNAPADVDGTWPCKTVCDVMEKIGTQSFMSALEIGLYNSRGVHSGGHGGEQERSIANQYKKWAMSVEFTHLKVHKMLLNMVRTYENEALRNDKDLVLNKRIRY